MSLKSRIDRLQRALIPPAPPPIVLNPENAALKQAIVDRIYGDPVRYADRIALFEEIMEREAKSAATVVAG